MLNVFSDPSYLTPDIPSVAMLQPFYGRERENQLDPDRGRYDKYVEIGHILFALTALETCDVAVVPVDWTYACTHIALQKRVEQFVAAATNEKKPIFVFYWNDATEIIPFADATILRTSVSGASTRSINEFAHPRWHEDPIAKQYNSVVPVRIKSSKATVGFCGFCTRPSLRAMAKRSVKQMLTRRRSFVPGHNLRWEAIQILQKSDVVSNKFILRDQFYGGAVTLMDGKWNFERKNSVRSEYIANILDTDYTLCIRGTGNYCHRLYETLCCGRIPVFVNTDCVLPYDFATDWKQHCVWVEDFEMHLLPEKIAAFHDSLSPSDFIDFQHTCRKFWQDWLSPEGFFRNLHRHLSA